MIINLHVKNLALISEADIEFTDGLNILTGETGAGKSIIIGSVNLALGAKADKEMIRTGAEYAFIEMTFRVTNEEQMKKLQEMDIPTEDGCIVLQRKIMPNRNVCKICGETVTGSQLKELAPFFLDIYGQHDHQSLLHPKKHLEILDAFGNEELVQVKAELAKEYREYRKAVDCLKEYSVDDGQRERELSLAEYELGEIEEARIQPHEDEDLQKEYIRLQNAYKITENLSNVTMLLEGRDENITDQLSRCLREISSIEEYDDRISQYASILGDVDGMIRDMVRDMKSYLEDSDFSKQNFEALQERLFYIQHLKEKYGNSLESIFAYEKNLEQKIDSYKHFEENMQKAILLVEQHSVKVEKLSNRLTKLRRNEATKLEKEIQDALGDLNFTNASFAIHFDKNKDYSANGLDTVEFLFSANAGEEAKPLSHVASGGELSRIMLAIKTVSAKRDEINSLIFDEIDTGISGKTAWKVSEKLGILAKNHQIICITHLPQIAAMADSHFLIDKEESDGKTYTKIERINQDGMLIELARMIGGETITDSAMNHARELKELAIQTKNNEF